jgi:hypothetical protein
MKDTDLQRFLEEYKRRSSCGLTHGPGGTLVPPPSNDFNPLFVLTGHTVLIDTVERDWREYMDELSGELLAASSDLPLIWIQLFLEFNSKISPQLEGISSRAFNIYGACLISYPMVTIAGVAKYFCRPGTQYFNTAFEHGLKAFAVDTVSSIASNEPVSGATLQLLMTYMKTMNTSKLSKLQPMPVSTDERQPKQRRTK